MSDPRIELKNFGVTFPVLGTRSSDIKQPEKPDANQRIERLPNGVVGVRALRDINFAAYDGDRIGVIGRNGSGKTTLLKCIAGIYPPHTGSICVRGRMASMLDINAGYDPDATGRENVEIRALFMGADRPHIAAALDRILEFGDLGPFIDLPLRTYSAGMRMRLSFAVATCLDPEILVMDEWLSAGDSDFRLKASQRMQELVERAGVLIIASHSGPLLAANCNKGLVLQGGRAIFFGDILDALESQDMLPGGRRQPADKKNAAIEGPKFGMQRAQDLFAIRQGLDDYNKAHNSFPNTLGVWIGIGRSNDPIDKWLPGLVPDFLPQLPRDPLNSNLATDAQYIYMSDGQGYKLIANNARDFYEIEALDQTVRPKIDPKRPTWGYGFWTADFAEK